MMGLGSMCELCSDPEHDTLPHTVCRSREELLALTVRAWGTWGPPLHYKLHEVRGTIFFVLYCILNISL